MTTSKLGAHMTDEQIEAVAKALRRAWHLGQTYWQQADSESYAQNRRSDETRKKFEALIAETRAASTSADVAQTCNPVPMSLTCPKCANAHVDEGEWATRPHKTHLCQSCGHQWRPFEYCTVGVSPAANVAQGAEAVSHEVFLVTADTNYEGNDVVRAFVRKEDAEAFAKKCQEYEWAYKSCPSVHAPESDWDKWQEDYRAWNANHPAVPYTHYDIYSVTPIAIEGIAPPAPPGQTASPINQCDGCRVGAPAVHRYPDGSRIGCTRDMYGVHHPEGIPTRVKVTCEFTDVIEQLEVIDATTVDGVVHVAVRARCPAPIAQTALTVTPSMVKAAMPWLIGLHRMLNIDAKEHIAEAIKAALAAAPPAQPALTDAARDAERYRRFKRWHPRLQTSYWTGQWWEPIYGEKMDACIDGIDKVPQPTPHEDQKTDAQSASAPEGK